MKKLVYFFVILVLFSSCIVEKRMYNKGYYIQKKSSKSKLDNNNVLLLNDRKINQVTISIDDSLEQKTEMEFETTMISEPCDTILLMNGDTLYGNVIIINDRWIAFDDCDSVLVKKPSFNRSRIHAIHYSNGEKEVFHKLTDKQRQELLNKKNPEYNKEIAQKLFRIALYFLLAAIAILCVSLLIKTIQDLLILALLCSIPALVFGIISIVFSHKKNDRKMKMGSYFIATLAFIIFVLAYHFTDVLTDLL